MQEYVEDNPITFNDIPRVMSDILKKCDLLEQSIEILHEEIRQSNQKSPSEHIPMDVNIIRKTKCFDFWERNVLFPKTKRSFFRTPKHPLPCPFPLNFSLLIITKKFGNLAKNRYICIV